ESFKSPSGNADLTEIKYHLVPYVIKPILQDSETVYVYGSKDRLFINTTLGCRSRCSYCYLPSLDYEVGASNLMIKDSDYVIEMVESRSDFIQGKKGTIISLGCYSECWDEPVRESTLALITYFLRKG
ncbi:hypothetical protein C5616_25645, partial [Vibrio anguillarum]|nr:hypothetical protein [Vibrio anguillarum]